MSVTSITDKPAYTGNMFNDNVSLIVGDQELSTQVQKILSPVGIAVKGVALSGSEDNVWNRDLQVVLWDNRLLLSIFSAPTWVEGSITRLIRHRFVDEQCLAGGTGLNTPSIFSGTDRVKKAQTCLEGGNVKFFGYDKLKGAVIGASSVIFTALYMENSRMFPPAIYELLRTDSPDAYEKVYDFVLGKIAEDLGIEKKNLLVMEHLNLHIDLELLLGPDKKAFLHDPQQARESFQYVRNKAREAMYSWEGIPQRIVFSESKAIERYEKSRIYERNKEKLERYGFKVIGVPGFNNADENAMGGYFLNGILLQDPSNQKTFLLTTAATYGHEFTEKKYSHFFAEPFSDVMKQNGISVIYLNCGEASGGGLHCMTTEIRKDGFSDMPHMIPIRSKDFPTYIPSRLQIEINSIESLTIITVDPSTGKETKWPMNLIPNGCSTLFAPVKYDSCFIDVPVPADDHLDFYLSSGEDQPELSKRGIILPGHPQFIRKTFQ
jgi:hypothetical protein